ncbi:MAG: glucokinase [Gammaproteobacteria bacterium]|nr:glucokinase [Gammaproteobacteria bacterium]
MKVLAVDLGGTKTLAQLVEIGGEWPLVTCERRYPSADFESFEALLEHFVERADIHGLQAACIAVAGPVTTREGRQVANVTNLPWTLDSRALAERLGVASCRLVNDFVAAAYGVDEVDAGHLTVLQPGEPEAGGSRAVVGAGSGLGHAILVGRGEQLRCLPSEAGHVAFAPLDDLQRDLWEWLRGEFGRVSCEHVLSGPGLMRIYRFLESREAGGEATSWPGPGVAAEAITTRALNGSDPVASRTLSLFTRIYGAHAGHFALTSLATGGVFIAGGIAPCIVETLHGGFLEAFRDQGPMSALVARLPLAVVNEPRVGLLGAARLAIRDARRLAA